MHSFSAKIEIIGVNPFVFVPPDILQAIFTQAGKSKGHIPIKGVLNQKDYKQTLVKFLGEWRLYINTSMLKDSPKRIGEKVRISIQFDPESREIKPPADFIQALNKNRTAKAVFERLPPSRQMEIVRYIARLKTAEAQKKNIQRAIQFLLGKERFIGREKP